VLKGMMEHRFPVVLGKDFAGTVEKAGEEISNVVVGDEVFGVLMREHLGDGTLADYVVVPGGIGLTKISPGLDQATAGALGLAGAAAYAAVDAVAPSSGETVLISGATGGVGAIATQLASARSAEVIATARPGEEADFVKSLGAAHTIDYSRDITEQFRSLRADGVHAVIHLAGNASQLADLVMPTGRMASTLGVTGEQLGDRDIEVTTVVAMPTASVLDRLAGEIAAGKLRVPIQRTYRLEETPQAIADFAQGTLGKLAIALT
jgi:NADPH2:quinone reductase